MERILGNARGENSIAGRNWGIAALAALLIFLSLPASAQAQKKNKNNNNSNASGAPIIPLPIPEQIDTEIGQMLGAFQLGELEKMHQFYADNASFVSGAYAPPVMGWQSYAAAYEKDRGLFQGMQVVRRNTSIFHSGDVAWACYQWELSAQYEGKPYFARGQTTLIFVKTGDTWLIVHNHTSQICPNEAARPKPPASNPANAPAAKP